MKNHSIKLVALLFVFAQMVACSDDCAQLTPLDDNAVIVAFGDSLTYGTGANSTTQSYPTILSQLTSITVINKGIPGEISQLGLERLADVLQETQPDLVILCHGGNDLIRKLNRQQLKNNLEQMIIQIQNSGAELVLIGVPSFNIMLKVPDLYQQLAEQYTVPIDLTIIPKIARDSSLKSDQVHPNAQGYKLMAEAIHQLLEKASNPK